MCLVQKFPTVETFQTQPSSKVNAARLCHNESHLPTPYEQELLCCFSFAVVFIPCCAACVVMSSFGACLTFLLVIILQIYLHFESIDIHVDDLANHVREFRKMHGVNFYHYFSGM